MAHLLVVTDNGYGILMEDTYPERHRGKKGNKSIKINERNGNAVAIRNITSLKKNTVLVLSRDGQVAKFLIHEMRVLNRNSQGVKVMDLDGDDVVVDVLVI